MEATLAIEPKAIKWHIMATMPPTDVLHRATPIITALLQVYNHVFMALPVEPTHTKVAYKEDQCFLWIEHVMFKQNKRED